MGGTAGYREFQLVGFGGVVYGGFVNKEEVMQTLLHIASLSFVVASFVMRETGESIYFSIAALSIALTAVVVGELRMLRMELKESRNG